MALVLKSLLTPAVSVINKLIFHSISTILMLRHPYGLLELLSGDITLEQGKYIAVRPHVKHVKCDWFDFHSSPG